MKQSRPICLASASPRRKELLERFALRFEVFAPQVDERLQAGETAAAHVARLAALKAETARRAFPDHLILAADTVVVYRNRILGKPAGPEDAARMLRLLSGRSHRVLSAYALLDGPSGERGGATVDTRVTFRALPPEWIAWYSRLPEAQDKAGAYGIQGVGGAMVQRIVGSYTNVVGFPIEHVLWALMERGWVTL
jgi:septum formation protein